MPYSTVDDLAEYMGLSDFGKREARAETMLEMASDEIRGIAPVPTRAVELPEYRRRSANTEKLVAEYLLATGGFRTSESKGVGGLSKGVGFADMEKVRGMIKGSMGLYATASRSGAASTITASSSFPLHPNYLLDGYDAVYP